MLLQIQSGAFDFTTPVIRLGDICHNLSQVNRYLGSTDCTWSVAEHSILCYWLAKTDKVDPDLLLPILLHDAHEYILGDANGVYKKLLGEWYHQTITRLDAAVAKKFGFSPVLFQAEPIRTFDEMALYIESKVFFKNRVDALWTYYDEKYSTSPTAISWIENLTTWRANLSMRKSPSEIALDLKDLIIAELAQ